MRKHITAAVAAAVTIGLLGSGAATAVTAPAGELGPYPPASGYTYVSNEDMTFVPLRCRLEIEYRAKTAALNRKYSIGSIYANPPTGPHTAEFARMMVEYQRWQNGRDDWAREKASKDDAGRPKVSSVDPNDSGNPYIEADKANQQRLRWAVEGDPNDGDNWKGCYSLDGWKLDAEVKASVIKHEREEAQRIKEWRDWQNRQAGVTLTPTYGDQEDQAALQRLLTGLGMV